MGKIILVALLCVVVLVHAEHAFRDSGRPHVVLGGGPFSLEELHARRRESRSGNLKYMSASELRGVYGIPYLSSGGAGTVIAIVDAYGASTAESDLAAFNTLNGLPACTTANGCFTKVNQNGGTTYPADDTTSNWGIEASMDVQAVHAFAPGAHILLVVTNSASYADLLAGVLYAQQHANYVSMSWGGGEETVSVDNYYFGSAPTVSFFASTGDNGAAGGVEWPSTSPHVVAVGGTSVYTDSSYNFAMENAWSGSGGGCSAVFTATTAQSSFAGYSSLGCGGKKAVPDVSYDADPTSGLVIAYKGSYYAGGGTSLAAPLFAARSALYGGYIGSTQVYASTPITFRDVTAGSNGYSAGTGLDLATGRGSWINYP